MEITYDEEIKMMWFKSCPRYDNGDMYLDEDDEKHCMQCGYTQSTGAALALSPEFARLLTIAEATAATLREPEAVAV